MKKIFMFVCVVLLIFNIIGAKSEFKKYNAIYWFEYLGTANFFIDTIYLSMAQEDLISNVADTPWYVDSLRANNYLYSGAIKLRQEYRGDGILVELPSPPVIKNYIIKLYSIKYIIKPFGIDDTILLSGIQKRILGSDELLTATGKQDTAVTVRNDENILQPSYLELTFDNGLSGYPATLYYITGTRFYTSIINFIVNDSVYIENIEVVYRYTRSF